MKKRKINADFLILFHPDLDLDIKEITLFYTLDGGKNWDDYYANKLTPKKYQITMYDLPENEMMEFYLEIWLKDSRVMKASKGGNNYKVQLVDKGEGAYKAEIRIKELTFSKRICLICEHEIPANRNTCLTPGCEATYCPYCNRILAPHSNYCPWDRKTFSNAMD